MVSIKSKGGDCWHYDVKFWYVVLDGNLLDYFHFNRNLFVKYVKLMYLQVSSDVTEKGILVRDKAIIKINFQYVYAGLMKETHIHT